MVQNRIKRNNRKIWRRQVVITNRHLAKEKWVVLKNHITNILHDLRGIVVKANNMKDTYAKREYKCKCGRITEDYVWQSLLEFHKVQCFKCDKLLGISNLKVKEVPQMASIRTPTKNR